MRGRGKSAVFLAVASTVLALAAVSVANAVSPQLTRPAYLTDVVQGHATVNWATDVPDASTVTYGPAPGCTGSSVPGVSSQITVGTRTEYQWVARLAGLAASTSYCYQITQDAVALLSNPPTFGSALGGGATSYSFAVLGDWGEATGGVNADQAKLLNQVARSGARFAISTGDIAYPDGNQTEYGDLQNTGGDSEVFGPGFWGVPGGSIPLFTAIGNHGYNGTFLQSWPEDLAVSSSGGSYSINSGGQPDAWYAFSEGNARFYILTAASAATNPYSDDATQHWAAGAAERNWLANDLATHPSQLKFAAFHFPLDANPGSDGYLQTNLQPLLDQYGVNIAFEGHIHSYQRWNPDSGGLVTYVTAGAGADLQAVSGCSAGDAYAIGWASGVGSACGSAPVPTSVSQVHHFLKVDVNGTTVTVTPIDENGNSFDAQTYSFGSSTVPSAPTSLTASAGPSATDLAWGAPASTGGSPVTGYKVYRSTVAGSKGTVVATVTGLSYSDGTAVAGTTYYYEVTAVNAAGEGPPSAQVSATAAAASVTAPSAPTGPVALPGNAAVSLSWTPPVDDGGAAVTSYTVYRSTVAGSRGGQLGTVAAPATTYTDTSAMNGAAYYYQVTASNSVGEGPVSTQVSATPMTVPGAPTAVAATASNASAVVRWTTPLGTGGSPITSYTVTAFDPAAPGGGGQQASAASSPVTVGGLVNGHRYTFTVTATNRAGTSARSVASNPVTPTPVDRVAPTVALLSPNRMVTLGRIAVAWSGRDVGSGIASYGVRYQRAAAGHRLGGWTYPMAWRQLTTTSLARSDVAGATDCFSVRARDRAGNFSAWTPARCTSIPLDDRALAASWGWRHATGPVFYRRTIIATRTAGARLASSWMIADRVALVVTTCPRCGSVRVYDAGRYVATVRLQSATLHRQAVIVLPRFPRRWGGITIRVVTTGRPVQIDGLAVTTV